MERTDGRGVWTFAHYGNGKVINNVDDDNDTDDVVVISSDADVFIQAYFQLMWV